MAKLRKTKLKTCELCCKPISKPIPATSEHNLSTVHNFWNYLYLQNVKDDLLPSSLNGENIDSSKIPKLTFSLTFGTAIKHDTANPPSIEVCEECKAKLGKLDKLHQQLESVKKLISCQLTKINDNRLKHKASQSNQLMLPAAEMNFNGCSIGKENISKTLTFLGTICDGIPATHSSKECQTQLRGEPPIPKGKVNFENRNQKSHLFEDTENGDGLDESLINKNDEIEVGEEFVSIVKMDPDVNEKNGDLGVPERDPLEITVEPKIKRSKYTKRLDIQTWKGPKKVYCWQCKKNIFGWNWERHEKLHKGERQFKCDLCPEKFIWKCNLYRHQRWHQNKLSKSKNIANEPANELVGLVEKIETKELDVTLSNESINDKIETAIDIEIGEEFVSIVKMEDDLVEEVDSQVPERDPLEIPVVSIKPKRKNKKHTDYPVGKSRKKLHCELCKKNVFRRDWETHQKWHAGEKQFKCELCNERFIHKNSLPRHMRWHQKELWIHACDKCGRKFLHNYKRRVHQRNCPGGEVP